MNDMTMARGEVEGGWNLAIGEPALMHRHLKYYVDGRVDDVAYPSVRGHSALVSELSRMYPGHEVVVANGAKQALAAAFYAFSRAGKRTVCHAPPYWPSYPTLAQMAGLTFVPIVPTSRSRIVVCVTSPNNPDGSLAEGKCDVWDAVYDHWVYGATPGTRPNARVIVNGASKLLGLPGLRVGWLATTEPALAEAARRYVEITTSGVSNMTQGHVAECLEIHLRDHVSRDLQFKAVRDDMLANAWAFNGMLRPHCREVRGVPDSGRGMFAFFRPRDEAAFLHALDGARVNLVSGRDCGMKHWYRMNMGHLTDYTQSAIEAIAKRLP